MSDVVECEANEVSAGGLYDDSLDAGNFRMNRQNDRTQKSVRDNGGDFENPVTVFRRVLTNGGYDEFLYGFLAPEYIGQFCPNIGFYRYLIGQALCFQIEPGIDAVRDESSSVQRVVGDSYTPFSSELQRTVHGRLERWPAE